MDSGCPYALAVILVAGVCAATLRTEHRVPAVPSTGASVARAPEAPLEAQAVRASVVLGTRDETRLELFDDQGRPLAGVRVRVDGRDVAMSDGRGLATLAGYGSAIVDVRTPGYHHRGRLSLAGLARIPLTRTGTISGRVIGARSELEPIVVRAFVDSSAEPAALASADGDGSFELVDVPAGLVRLAIAGPGTTGVSSSLRLAPGRALDDILIVAEPGFSIDGTAFVGGRPAAGAAVSWAPGEYVPIGAKGDFSIRGLTAGRYPLRIALLVDGGWMTSSAGGVDVEVEDADAKASLRIDELFALEVDVAGDDGVGLAGVGVHYEREGATGTTRVDRTTDEQGRARLAGIPRGRLAGLRASIPWSSAIEVDVPALGPARIEVPPVGRVYGTLSWSGGEPAHDVPCSLRDQRGRVVVATTDQRGVFSYPPIPVGSYQWQCFSRATSVLAIERGAATGDHAVPVRVAPDHSTRIEADLEAALPAVRGVVTRAGRPVANADVAIYAAGQSDGLALDRTIASVDGRFVLEAEGELAAFDVVAEGASGWGIRRGLARGGAAVEVTLEATGRIEASIPPRAGAHLWRGSVQIATARAKAHPGTATFEGLAPGRYRLTVNESTDGAEVTVTAGQTSRVDLRPAAQPPR